ncbi:MAG: hypothetical protein WCR67_02195 [Bacilli bacterium]
MDENKYLIKEAIKLLKGGYPLASIIRNQQYSFRFSKDGKFRVTGDFSGLVLSEYDFESLYKDSVFFIDYESMDEETVDMKKDEEYYSWRQ